MNKFVTCGHEWSNAQNCNEEKYIVDSSSHVLLKDEETPSVFIETNREVLVLFLFWVKEVTRYYYKCA